MKVILKKNFESLGHAGDIVNVKDGYFRNFLQPRAIAVPYTEGGAKQIKMLKTRAQKFADDRKEKLNYLKDRIEALEMVFERKTSEAGKLFGSITLADIHRELADKGIDLEKKAIKLDDHIKLLGEYRIDIELARDIVAGLRVEVREE